MARRFMAASFAMALACFSGASTSIAQVCPADIPHLTGTWDVVPYQMPINPISANLLPDGKVLIVSGSENDAHNYQTGAQSFRAAVWDPQGSSASSIDVQNLTYDVFCSGTAALPDGRSLVVGGTASYAFTGDARASIFDWKSGRFAQTHNMAQGRWYASIIALGDGSMMAMSGLTASGATGTLIEIYDPKNPGGGWRAGGTMPFTPPLYPKIMLLPNGNAFYTGHGAGASNPRAWIFNPSSTTWTASALTTRNRVYGAAVLLPLLPPNYTPRVMNLGGGNPATASTDTIDLSAGSPVYSAGPNMSAARIQINAVLLPNGRVLAAGGSATSEVPDAPGRTADLYNPATNTFSSAGIAAFSRLYHSTALLLPDGRVASLGSNPRNRGTYEGVMEIYTPPYLYDANNRLIVNRPTITAMSPASGVIGYGAQMTVSYTSASAISSAVLMRPGSTTHGFDMEQRMIGLCGPAPQPSCTASNNALSLTMPSSGNVAPPGYYMLFLLDSAGVPSVAKIIQLTPFATVAPAGTISSPTANVTVTAGNSVSFSTTTAAAKYSWVFPGGAPAASIAQNPGNVIFATPGTYQVSLTAVDSSGHADPHPPTRTITVLPTTGNFSIEVSPAAVQVVPGGTATFNVTVKSLSGFAGSVTLAVSSESGFPAGITSVGFSPSIINNGAGSSTLTMTTTTATVPYALSLTIKGTSGTLSHTAATTLIVALAPPGGLSAAPGDRSISLSWPASIGASSYQLARSLFSGGPYQTLACPASTGFLDSGLVNGTTYFYVVSAAFIGGSNGGGESAKSVQASATPVPPTPGTPTGLSAQASSGRVALTWNAVAGSTSYRVKRATVTGGPYNSIANPSNTAYTDTAVTNGTTYYYVVSAVNAGGESANSAQVSATPVAGTSGGQSLFTAQTPAQPSASDGVAYELGMKFRAAQAGTITALRYWKAANDTGMHTGRLWSASGTLLGSVAFTNETASGWQQQSLPTAIQTQANTTYVVSVNVGLRYPFTGAGLATSIVNGDLSSVADGNNGVYGNPGSFPRSSFNSSNYFRDVVFVRAATGAATKLGLSANTSITSKGLPVTFTARVQDANGNTVSTASNPITFAVAGVTGAFNPASTVNAANGVATSTFTPSSAGNATVSVSASGLTGASATLFVAAATQSLFTTQTPVRPAVSEGRPYELGMKFRLSKAGVINGIRFYKSVGDTGTHVGRIWSANGTLLASVPFTGETASGWQQQLLATPLPVQANITYIVSTNIVSTYPFTGSGLATSIVNGNISSVADGGNGVYGNASAFPTNSFQNANYFRDIVFSPGP